MSPDVVRKSFEVCGISNEIFGTEDYLLFQDADEEVDFKGLSAEDNIIAAETCAKHGSKCREPWRNL